MTSLDYMLQNFKIAEAEEIPYNPYIKLFCSLDCISQLQHLTKVDNAIKQLMNHRHLKKEITETVGTLHIFEMLLNRLHKMSIANNNGRYQCDLLLVNESNKPFSYLQAYSQRLVFYDICSGKGTSSFIIKCFIPNATIHLVDNNSSINLNYLNSDIPQCQQLSFHKLDIYSSDFESFLLQSTLDTIKDGNIPMIFGNHLCGTLSTRLVELYNHLIHIPFIIVSPCCMPTNKRADNYFIIKQKIKRNKWSGYDYWSLVLYTMIDSKQSHRNVCDDEYVESDKSKYIWAFRMT
eukprot:gene3990-5714_t